ncbi:hypothetical protein B0A49_10073 [Cryomyces minteri]|uniref:Photolyase/cryptochrome alpha/beta domain-containing protein n=1 Tax=Cryomyces minteri TaxID=331657 RepID=A0A4U0X4Y5_9PEZI|nr:hypothetical protein B0A49_10073 [Cryomyces minteri]
MHRCPWRPNTSTALALPIPRISARLSAYSRPRHSSLPKMVLAAAARPPSKRKASSTSSPPPPKKPAKRPTSKLNGASQGKPDTSSAEPSASQYRPEERYGIVQREFYPPEMSNERAARYRNGEIPRPIEVLSHAIEETADARAGIEVGEAVVHWYKRDLRLHDNRALSLASAKAKEKGVPLICMFIVSPQDYQAHYTSPARVDFELRTLAIIKEDLAKLDIPLYVETREERKTIPDHIVGLCQKWGAKHLYCNIEYEVDELRREASMTRKCLDAGINFTAVHDDVVVAPGKLRTGTGNQYAVYSPWFRSWIAHIHSNPGLLDPFDPPGQNPSSARQRFNDIFQMPIPAAPENKKLTDEERKRFEHLWPAGEHEASQRLEKFLGQKVAKYKDARNLPAANSTACISVHHSAGTLAARTSVRRARDLNGTKKLDAGNEGVKTWISEVAWRDFYKHVLAHWPYVCMHKPFKYEYANIEWEYNDEHFERWCKGQTGYPIVDAGMRQLLHSGWMHNRLRMITASFLAKDLLLDWRLGEAHFMTHLIDGDFASNNGGWGFSASTGVDRSRTSAFDPAGDYIRKWVPELRAVAGKAVHDPYGRGAAKEAEKKGYPRVVVEHKGARERALARYKEGIGRETI